MSFDLSPAWISLKIALVSTFFVFFLGIFTAWKLLNAGKKKRLILESLFTLPMLLPPTAVGFILLLLLGNQGPIGYLFNKMGFPIIFTWQAAALASAIVSFPLMYKSTRAAFQQIDPALLESAQIFGSSNWGVLWGIALPLAAPGVISGAILAFVRAIGEFGATMLVAGSIPGKTQTISIALYFASQSGDIKTASIWAAIIYVLSLAVMISSSILENKMRR